MKGYYPSTRQNEHSLNPSHLSGLTLVEVVVSMGILSISILSVISGFIYMQRSAMDSSYHTGAQRILQSHIEGINGMSVKDLVTTNFVAYNYSGLRVSSLSDTNSQAALTNVANKTFGAFTVSGGNIVPVTITAAEDAVIAYSIFYDVVQTNISSTYKGISGNVAYTKPYRRAEIKVIWYNTFGMSNQINAIVMKPEEN